MSFHYPKYLGENIEIADRSFRERVKRIREDLDMPQEQKDRALAKLKEDKRSYYRTPLNMLRQGALEAAAKAEAVRLAIERQKAYEGGKLDYSRLAYETGQVKSVLALAGADLEQVDKAFTEAKACGDCYQIRAWVDGSAEAIAQHAAHSPEWRRLGHDIQAAGSSLQSEVMSRLRREYVQELEGLEAVSNGIEQLASVYSMPVEGLHIESAASPSATVIRALQVKREARAAFEAVIFDGIAGRSDEPSSPAAQE